MKVVYERCAGCDIHKKAVTVHVVVPEGGETRTFGTTTTELLDAVEWLQTRRVTHLAIESTGVYWKPLYNLLEATGLTVFVVNAAHMKAVPGRKTDVQDAVWICDLMRHGLLKASFIPPRAQRELRELVRYRISLTQERADEANRIQKVLEGGNIKLGSVVSDILGKSGRAILAAIVGGTSTPEELAALADPRVRATPEELTDALRGRLTDHQRMLLRMQLDHVRYLEQQLAALDAEVAKRLAPFEAHLNQLDTIPGVNQRTAENVVAVIGTDMTRFPSADHLVSWAGMCPGSNESGGKRRHSRTRKGNTILRSTLTQAGQAAGRTRNTYLGTAYHRIAARRGKKRAAIAVGRRILEIAYFVLRDGVAYEELGANYYDERKKTVVVRNAVKRLERLGYRVVVEPAA
ncbi:MAG TPA: IS110 family transposase [bacterium]|nr:IS110 family transposase [bacterium]